jgi:hypothetical protein
MLGMTISVNQIGSAEEAEIFILPVQRQITSYQKVILSEAKDL